MKSFFSSFSALPVHRLSQHPDVALAIGVVAIVGMLVLPLPPQLLDVFLAFNLALSMLLLVATLITERPLAISTFPTLLLITTLFRLALNVSSTRMILGQGTAGEVVEAFGEFVIRGDLVVGLVVFLVITLVQFMVIGKGAERVAEVSARFTLDAMPGKQMSIDAALRSGALTEDQAQDQRNDLGRESQFYGAMDGAMKFVKGDAIAGLIITAINLIGGIVVGVLRMKMSFAQAGQQYSLLTIGDGLVSQLPALLISIAAGVLTTRVAGKQPKVSLGGTLKGELFGNPKVVGIGAGFALVLGLIPGLPLVPFVLIAVLLGFVCFRLSSSPAGDRAAEPAAFQGELDRKVKQAKAQKALVDSLAPAVPMIGLELDPVLSEALGFGPDVADTDTQLVGQLIPSFRDVLYFQLGVRFPGIEVRDRVSGLAPGTAVIRIKDIPVAEVKVPLGCYMALESPERLERFGVSAESAVHPTTGGRVALISSEHAEDLRAAGVNVHDAGSVLMLHLARVLMQNAKSFVGLHEASDLVERLSKIYPALVKEVTPKLVSLAQLADILRRLVDEGVSIRDSKTIFEALAEHAPYETDMVALTEMVRGALSLQLAHAHAGVGNRLSVLLLDPMIEDTVRSAITPTAGGKYLALEPELRRAIVKAIGRTLEPVLSAGVRPVILTGAEVRRYVRKLIEEDLSLVSVLSYQELPAQLIVQPVGRVALPELSA